MNGARPSIRQRAAGVGQQSPERGARMPMAPSARPSKAHTFTTRTPRAVRPGISIARALTNRWRSARPSTTSTYPTRAPYRTLSHQRPPVFTLTGITGKTTSAMTRRTQSARAVFKPRGGAVRIFFELKTLRTDGCGSVWQLPNGRFQVVSTRSGHAYMRGQIR